MWLIYYLQNLTALSAEFRSILHNAATVEQYLPHQVIFAKGHPETRIWFVSAGLLRQYYFDESGKEHTTEFYRENDVLFSLRGYQALAAEDYVETLETSILFAIPYHTVKAELQPFPETTILTQLMLKRYDQQERFKRRMLLLSAEKRYRLVRQKQNWLFSRISLRLIATYLNMTRENLSRLMARDL